MFLLQMQPHRSHFILIVPCCLLLTLASESYGQTVPDYSESRRCLTTEIIQSFYQSANLGVASEPGNVLFPTRPTVPGEAGRTGGFGHTYTTPVVYYDSPEGHFRIWYTNSGADRPGLNLGVPPDQDVNGVPDWIERCSEYFEQSYQTAVVSMGFRTPPDDFSFSSQYTSMGLDHGGDGRYDVYIQDIGASIAGFTGPEQVISGRILPSYIVIDNDFSGVKNTVPEALELLQATAAHELFHAIQFAYDVNEDIYWLEQSAVWMEEQVFDDVNDYYNYLSTFTGFLSQPWLSLDTRNGQHEFAGILWPLYLSEKYDPSIIRSIWELAESVQSLDAFDQALQARSSSLEEDFQEFTIWNVFTAARSDPTRYYEEGAAFPLAEPVDSLDTFPVMGPDIPSGRLPSHLGTNYVMFTPDPFRSGGLQIDFDGINGRWGVSLVGISTTGPDTVITVPLSLSQSGIGVISDWEQYDVIMLVAASLERSGSNYLYQFTATFDSTLVSRQVPTAMEVSNGPNPVYFSTANVKFMYELPSAGQVTLNIYNILGQEIYSVLEPRLPPGYFIKLWDISDRTGRRAPSGVYIYRLTFTDQAGSQTSKSGKLLLVN